MTTQFHVAGATTRWHNGFLRIEDLDVIGPRGEHLERTVVRHPGAVVVVPIDEAQGEIVLVRQYRAALDHDLLEVVAGKRDVAGEAPTETAQRELGEEIGMRAVRLVALCEFYNTPGFCDEYTYLYCALGLESLDGPRAATEEEAAMTVERVPLDAVDHLIATGAIIDAKTIVGLSLTRRYLAGDYPGMVSPPP